MHHFIYFLKVSAEIVFASYSHVWFLWVYLELVWTSFVDTELWNGIGVDALIWFFLPLSFPSVCKLICKMGKRLKMDEGDLILML